MEKCKTDRIEWKTSADPVPYLDAVKIMEDRVSAIHKDGEKDMVWALEHPSLYTAGTSANAEDLKSADFPIFQTGRGGEYTYHGPNQRIYYFMFNLKYMFEIPDIKKYIWFLEECIIQSLLVVGVLGERREGRVGIWVICPDGTEKKIAAIGVRVRHWVSYHGVSVNLSPDLNHFSGIVPCGISEYGVTSLSDLGITVSSDEFDDVFRKNVDIALNLLQAQG
jgi:lipoyl(octanoyl) transferase